MQNEYLTCIEGECLISVDINGTFYSCSKDFKEPLHYSALQYSNGLFSQSSESYNQKVLKKFVNHGALLSWPIPCVYTVYVYSTCIVLTRK